MRALLTPRLGLLRATRAASRIGQTLAVLLGVWGLLSANLFLMLIAVFVFVGARAETQTVMINALLVYTKSLGACIIMHAVTNLLLAVYVLKYQAWHLW